MFCHESCGCFVMSHVLCVRAYNPGEVRFREGLPLGRAHSTATFTSSQQLPTRQRPWSARCWLCSRRWECSNDPWPWYFCQSVVREIYIYICCRVKTWSKNSLFLSQNLVQVFLFYFFLFFKHPLLSAVRMTFFRKTRKKRKNKTHFLSQNLVQFCCATYLDQVLTQPWTRFWLNNFCNLGVFLPVLKCTKTTIFIVFSAKKRKF